MINKSQQVMYVVQYIVVQCNLQYAVQYQCQRGWPGNRSAVCAILLYMQCASIAMPVPVQCQCGWPGNLSARLFLTVSVDR